MCDSPEKESALSLARGRMVRSRELEALGVSRVRLRQLVAQGILKRIRRGLYTAADDEAFHEHESLAEVAARSPKSVICLLSALRFHDLTTENPSEVYLFLPPGTRRPHISSPQLAVFWTSEATYRAGVEEHVILGVRVKITSPAKTIADCFKYRSKVGINVAVEALNEAWRRRKATADELWRYAKLCRMSNVMRPYFESMTI
ncbi:MAG TPA: type IV toxin-antitoxin system AbiEi family antitoxin domain-containing protein [Chthoniobacteraceae bacterium]|nr:type IV toxin-antitoxin system AbiEi family antitoxin domain-containing protein [Chthoniobacteraceae bacterium]